MPISENIKILRERYGITQKELAEIAGVTDKAVSTWELGINEPRMGVIQKIADKYGLQKSSLIEDGGMELKKTTSKPERKEEKPAETGELNPLDKRIIELFGLLSEQNRKIALAQIETLLRIQDSE